MIFTVKSFDKPRLSLSDTCSLVEYSKRTDIFGHGQRTSHLITEVVWRNRILIFIENKIQTTVMSTVLCPPLHPCFSIMFSNWICKLIRMLVQFSKSSFFKKLVEWSNIFDKIVYIGWEIVKIYLALMSCYISVWNWKIWNEGNCLQCVIKSV